MNQFRLTLKFTIFILVAQCSFSLPGALGQSSEIFITDNGKAEEFTEASARPSIRKAVAMGAENRRELYTIPANTTTVRVHLSAQANIEGMGPFLAWEDFVLFASFEENAWSFHSSSSTSAETSPTEFRLGGDAFIDWIVIDLVRAVEGTSERRMIFVNGSLIADGGLRETLPNDTISQFQIFQTDFADIAFERVSRQQEVPDFAKSSARIQKSKEGRSRIAALEPGIEHLGEEAIESTKRIPDAVKRDLADLPRFAKKLRPGELSFEEEAWFLTETVNRTYYAYVVIAR
jgi:hypothetical protein